MEVWLFWGAIALLWLWSIAEDRKSSDAKHPPDNINVTYHLIETDTDKGATEKEFQRNYHIWTTQINGSGVDPNSYWGRIREEVFRRYHNCCANCGAVENLTVHHKQPLSLGGSNDIDNLILLCKDCHESGHGRKFMDRAFEADANYGKRHRVSEKVVTINNAIKNQMSVQIKYTDMHGVRSFRTIHPEKIRRRNRGVYTLAYCDLDKDFRIFRLSRMKIYKTNENKNFYIDEPKSFDQLEQNIVEDFKKLFS